MPVAETIVRQAVQALETGDHRRARTLLEEALGNPTLGHWTCVSGHGYRPNKAWTKEGHFRLALANGRARDFSVLHSIQEWSWKSLLSGKRKTTYLSSEARPVTREEPLPEDVREKLGGQLKEAMKNVVIDPEGNRIPMLEYEHSKGRLTDEQYELCLNLSRE